MLARLRAAVAGARGQVLAPVASTSRHYVTESELPYTTAPDAPSLNTRLQGLGNLINVLDEAAATEATDPFKRQTGGKTFKLFNEGQFTRPHDFTYEAQTAPYAYRKPYKLGPASRQSRKQDPFRQEGIDPVYEYLNRPLLQSFTSEVGMILPRSQTGLSWWGQRRVGKAIRRARAMYLMEQFHRPQTRRPKRIDTQPLKPMF